MEPITAGAITLAVTAYGVALMVARHRRHQHVQSGFCLPEPSHTPPMRLVVAGRLTDAQAARLKAEWAARMARPGAVMVLEPGQRFEALPQRQTWRTSCEGCGAPLQRNDLQCSYCLRATAMVVDCEIGGDAAYLQQQNFSLAGLAKRELIDVTTMEDAAPRYLTTRQGPR